MLQLLDNTPLDAEQKDYVKTISASGDALLCIINDILDYSKIEAGKMEFESVEVRLDNLIDDCVSVFTQKAKENNNIIVVDVSSDIPLSVKTDPTRLRQIILNLLGNALKFTESGMVILSVTFVTILENGKNRLRFSVKDSGIGMTEEQKGKLFGEFNQASSDTSRNFGGTGLGLAISKKLVELMGGQIGVESEVNKGSEFYFTHSVVTLDENKVFNWNGKHIALACDNLSVCTAVEHRASLWGCDTTILGSQEHDNHRVYDSLVVSKMLEEQYAGIQRKSTVLIGSDEPNSLSLQPLQLKNIDNTLAKCFGEKANEQKNESVELPSFAHLRVLVAEDNLVNQKVIEKFLDKLNIATTIVTDGEQAFEHIKEQPNDYDVILMDCEMPNMDGYEATTAIKNLDEQKLPYIIGLSAHAVEEKRQLALEAGMDSYLTKPIVMEKLISELQGINQPKQL